MDNIIVKLQEWLAMYGLKVVAAVAILVIGWIAARVIRSIFRRILLKSQMDKTLISFLTSVSYVTIMVFVIIAALGKLGMQTASFIAIIGAAGLAIGLALQGALTNFASGVLMIIFKPIKLGDFIDAAGTMGVVDEIGIFTTILKSPDNKKIIVPNGKLTKDNITNFTAENQRRVDLVAGVSYNDDLDKVRKVLESILSEDDRILKDPAPTIGVLELADSSVNLAVRPWVSTPDYWDVFFAIQEKIKKRFDAEGISIPFPQQDVHIHKTEQPNSGD
ncbi:mechanosensitive ion channel [bacterium]|nr:mechanosensitive ion channel [bacterium]